MGELDYDVDDLMNCLDRLADQVPAAIPKAIDAMANVLVPKLRAAAPEDTGELKKAIGKSNLRTSKNGVKYKLVFVKNRGENDRNVYKAVVAEYGRSGKNPRGPLQPKPFWRRTVNAAYGEMLEAGKKVMEEAVEKAKRR